MLGERQISRRRRLRRLDRKRQKTMGVGTKVFHQNGSDEEFKNEFSLEDEALSKEFAAPHNHKKSSKNVVNF
jgi:hypothetical protein